MPAPERHLTLFVPGLRQPPVAVDTEQLAAVLRPDSLERLLARADEAKPLHGVAGPERTLFHLFGVPVDARLDPPVAAVTHFIDTGERDDGWYLRADPVHLRADLNKLILFDAGTFSLSEEEARSLAGEVRGLLDRVGGELSVPAPGRWYLRLSRPPDIRTSSLGSVAGRGVHDRLPQGDAGADWRGLLNEIQMTLHLSPVNQARGERGEPAVNSLWFWGGGRLPESVGQRWDHVWSDDTLAQGLARLAGGSAAGSPEDAESWLGEQAPAGHHLVSIGALRDSVRYGDMEGWLARLDELEQRWTAPLWEGLRAGRIAGLTLVDDRGFARRITRRATGRWWRRTRPFMEYLTKGGE